MTEKPKHAPGASSTVKTRRWAAYLETGVMVEGVDEDAAFKEARRVLTRLLNDKSNVLEINLEEDELGDLAGLTLKARKQ